MRSHRGGGFALGATIAILALVFMLAAAYSTRTSQHLFNATYTMASLKAGYLCEGGVRYGVTNIREQLKQQQQLQQQQPPQSWKFQPFQITLTFETGTVTVGVTEWGGGNSDGYRVRSVARCGRAGKILEIEMNGNGAITQWRESTL